MCERIIGCICIMYACIVYMYLCIYVCTVWVYTYSLYVSRYVYMYVFKYSALNGSLRSAGTCLF